MADGEDRCELTDLPRSGCAHCRGHADHDDTVEPDGHVFIARYETYCPDCHFRIDPGDRITGGEHGGYVHEGCK